VDDESVDKIRAESIITKYLFAQMMVLSSPLTTAQLLKRFTPLLAAPVALLLNPGRADAVLTYNIFQSGPDVVVQTNGSINQLPTTCCTDGPSPAGIFTAVGYLSTGSTSNTFPIYPISGPATIPASPLVYLFASNFSGVKTVFSPGSPFGIFGIDAYVIGTEINSSATFNSTTLAVLGFITPGLIGTWTIVGPPFETGSTPTPFDTINVVVGPPAAGGSGGSGSGSGGAAVPGPLPLLGVAATFGWSRRLRHRIANAKTPAAG
jgi:hypothetical protein